MIRTQVFVMEQGISAEIETDEWENHSTHYLASDGEKVLATARRSQTKCDNASRLINNQTAKIERVAVLKEARSTRGGNRIDALCSPRDSFLLQYPDH